MVLWLPRPYLPVLLFLVVLHGLFVPLILLAPPPPPLGSVVPLISVIRHDLVFLLIPLDLVAPLIHMIPL